jgi:DNA invertase Pin-like site-specific DNA recombinase
LEHIINCIKGCHPIQICYRPNINKNDGKIMKKVAIYARVSTDKQTSENQLIELRETAKRMNFNVIEEFIDHGISGTKSRIHRPALDAMLKLATQRKIEMILCWDISRLGRSLQHLIEILNELQTLKCDLYFHQNGIDTSTITGRMIFQVCGSLAEFERNLIRERVIAGQQRAKSEGRHIGRPTQMNDSLRTSIKLLREQGMAIKRIAKTLSIGVGTVYSVITI